VETIADLEKEMNNYVVEDSGWGDCNCCNKYEEGYNDGLKDAYELFMRLKDGN
jgi:hypothetical protein